LFLIQAMQEIGLILLWILCTKQMVFTVALLDARIVPRRQMVAVELSCAVDQEAKFHE